MSQLIMNAILAEAQAKEARALANLNNYMTSAVGVGEHPDILDVLDKEIEKLDAARSKLASLSALFPEPQE